MKNPTLYDVAKLSGLSIGTVSGYINGKKISVKNIKKIKDAIDVLKYTPQSAARSLASGKSFSILLYVMVESPIVSSTWMQELPIVQGICDVMNGSEYTLKIEIADATKAEKNLASLERVINSRNTDGAILVSPWQLNEEISAMLKYRKFPYILIGGGNHFEDAIEFNNRAPIIDIVRRQYEKGHRKMAFIGGFQNQDYVKQRVKGFCTAHHECSLLDPAPYIKYGDYSFMSGVTCTLELLSMDDPPDMIVCCNDHIAAGAIRAIKSKGLRIPQDVSVSGFDDTIIATTTTPTITSVRVPSYEIGKKAIDELFLKLENNDYSIPKIFIDCEVLYRESTD